MTEPRTETGRALLAALGEYDGFSMLGDSAILSNGERTHLDPLAIRDGILAIEAEARALPEDPREVKG